MSKYRRIIGLNAGFLYALLMFACPTFTFGQKDASNNLEVCVKHTANRGRYKILSTSPGGVESQIYITIKPKDRNDQNYVAIAKEFKERYCHEAAFRIIYYKDKKHQYSSPLDPGWSPLAIFFYGRNTAEKTGLSVYSVIDGKVSAREFVIDE